MKRIGFLLLLSLLRLAGGAGTLAAQQEPKPAAAEVKPDEAKPAEEKKTEDTAAESPSPAAEQWISGNIDFGYRWRSGVGGNMQTYRSVANYGSGPKLFGADLLITDPKSRLFDTLSLFATTWGGDPNQTLRVAVQKRGVYRFQTDYRDIAYFNYLSAYANPNLSLGSMMSERTYHIRRRYLNSSLELRPGKRIIPYLEFSHDANDGTGITTFEAQSNQYPVNNRVWDGQNVYRGGVRFEMNRWHITLEQGGSTFKDDNRTYWSGLNNGNRTTPYFGQNLTLSNLNQAYGIRGSSIFEKVIATAAPTKWLNLYGQFLYAEPKNDITYSENAQGNFLLLSALSFYGSSYDTLTGAARQPHTSATFGFEMRPFSRLRIVDSVMTDHYHTASAGVLAEQLFFTAANVQSAITPAVDRLVYNYNQHEVNAFFDITSKITLRGGYRFVWGDAQVRSSTLNEPLTGPFESGELRRHVGIAGLNYRLSQKLNANFQFEASDGIRTYFRTDLQDYRKANARARYQALASLLLTANFTVMNNRNPVPTVDYSFQSRTNTFGVEWAPQGSKYFSFYGDYTRSSLRSDIEYLAPQFLNWERSLYRENAHVGVGMLEMKLPQLPGAELSLGGSVFISSGSHPSRFYEPVGRVVLPLRKHVNWTAEWRFYGVSDIFYSYEAFRAHIFQTGLRFTL